MGEYRPKKVIFHTRFQTQPSGYKNYVIIRLERKQKISSNAFQICIFLFLSYSCGIETINTFIGSLGFLKNHTRFQTKMGKVYTHFQTKKVQTFGAFGSICLIIISCEKKLGDIPGPWPLVEALAVLVVLVHPLCSISFSK